MKVHPPNRPLHFLRWFCREDYLEEIEGDLTEVFKKQAENNPRQAKWRFTWSVMKYFRPAFMKSFKNYQHNSYDMLQSYFKIGWRNLIKQRSYSFISIFGLSVSIALGLLIFHYALFELQYDQFNERANLLYRVTSNTFENNQKVYENAETPHSIAETLKEKLPEVAESARLMSTRYWFDCTLKYANNQDEIIFNERTLYYADPSFLSIFSFNMERGDRAALAKPFSAVLSSSAAKRYFGEQDPIGKVLHLKGSFEENDYTVTGVMYDLPRNSHMDATVLLPISSLDHNRFFENFDAYTYIKLASSANHELVKEKIQNFASMYLPKLTTDKTRIQLDAQPITDIHLHSLLQNEIKPGGNAKAIYFLLLVVFVILLIAWINHINLATARAATRAKEAGIRKVSGASRLQLVNQFLVEAFIINGLSLTFAIILILLFSQFFFQIIGLPVSTDELLTSDSIFIGLSISLILFFGVLIAGLYPASIISSYNPALVLKGKEAGQRNGFTLRRVLVVFQFACAICLTATVIIFNQQFRFMQSHDLGIDIERTLIIKAPTVIDSSYATQLSNFKTQLQAKSIIASVASSSSIPGEEIGWTGEVRRDQNNSSAKLSFVVNIIDTDFIEAYRLKLLAGRNFKIADYPSGQFGSKIEPVILNKMAIKQLGFEAIEDAIGASMFWGENKCLIVGVIDDFHQQSLKKELSPILFSAGGGSNLSVKLGKGVDAQKLTASISSIHDSWKTFFPGNPFDYFLLGDFYKDQYKTEAQVINLFHFYCGFAILISSLGLFGLASFTAQQKTKEIGIRKVLGASIASILFLLSKDFVKLILIAAVIATTTSWIILSDWLKGFAYKIDINWAAFVISVLLVGLVGLLTICYQSAKAASTNPVNSLKSE
ncbi:MAG: ABC transporter permease [Cyclobacteriaceae bacterium]